MASLYLKNIGPLIEIDIELNRVNVFIGPQSSGKSTVAKIISFCNWLEKDCVLEQDIAFINREFIVDKLINYYNLQEYFHDDSVLRYRNQNISLEIVGEQVTATKTGKLEEAFLTKNSYIPSERNMLALPGIFSIKMPPNYLQEFIVDWLEIRPNYAGDEKLSILGLGEAYFFNASKNIDRIKLKDGRDIDFSQASSGLQSVTPLCVCIDYLTSWVYENAENRSAEDSKKYREAVLTRGERILRSYISERFTEEDAAKLLSSFWPKSEKEKSDYPDAQLKEVLEKYPANSVLSEEMMFLYFARLLPTWSGMQLAFPMGTNLVIEEPEQNLFPKTQVELVYDILTRLQFDSRTDSLVMTTHSPYILYALNNCMLAGLTGKKDEEKVDLIKEFTSVPRQAWVDPSIISVWELEDGHIRGDKTIQDERGLIRGNFFDRVMQNVMADFNSLVNFIEV